MTTPRFHGKERVDATEAVALRISRADVVKSVAGDPAACIVAQTANRQPTINESRIGARFAYLTLRSNPEVVTRYQLSAKDARRVHVFDEKPEGVRAAAEWIEGLEITLLPPSPSKRLGYKSGKRGTGVRATGKAHNLHHAPSLRHLSVERSA